MEILDFSIKWIGWIKVCLESSTISFLVNDSPLKEFKPMKELRQCDPMTPFLFLIVVEEIVAVYESQIIKKKLYGRVHVGRNNNVMSLLQFTNDTLFLCETSYQT